VAQLAARLPRGVVGALSRLAFTRWLLSGRSADLNVAPGFSPASSPLSSLLLAVNRRLFRQAGLKNKKPRQNVGAQWILVGARFSASQVGHKKAPSVPSGRTFLQSLLYHKIKSCQGKIFRWPLRLAIPKLGKNQPDWCLSILDHWKHKAVTAEVGGASQGPGLQLWRQSQWRSRT